MKFEFRLPKHNNLSRGQKRAIDEINPILVTGVPDAYTHAVKYPLL